MRDGRICPPTTPPHLHCLGSKAGISFHPDKTTCQARPVEGGGSQGGAVKQVNRMMVVYGFGPQGARLCVRLCNDREEASCSLWMLPGCPQPALKGERLGRVASHHHQIGAYSFILNARGCVSVNKADPEIQQRGRDPQMLTIKGAM